MCRPTASLYRGNVLQRRQASIVSDEDRCEVKCVLLGVKSRCGVSLREYGVKRCYIVRKKGGRGFPDSCPSRMSSMLNSSTWHGSENVRDDGPAAAYWLYASIVIRRRPEW